MILYYESFDKFHAAARACATDLAMEVVPCTLLELEPDWVTSKYSISRPDRSYFTVEGVRILRAAGLAVKRWVQPIFVQPNGHVGLIHCAIEDSVLIRMFAEPGNIGIEVRGKNTRVLVGPPAQFSPGNLSNHMKALRGEKDPNGEPYKRIPFADIAADACPAWAESTSWEPGSEDGGRFWQKVNLYGYVRVQSREAVQDQIYATGQAENFAWVSREVLREARKAGMVNGHLRSAMSLLV